MSSYSFEYASSFPSPPSVSHPGKTGMAWFCQLSLGTGQLSGFRPLFSGSHTKIYFKCMLDRRPAEIRRHLRKTKSKSNRAVFFLRHVYHMLYALKRFFVSGSPAVLIPAHRSLCQVTDCLTISFSLSDWAGYSVFPYLRTCALDTVTSSSPFPQNKRF